MAYYQGGTLRDLMDEGPLPVVRAAQLASQIASGLEAAHRKGVLHRDIKPENILLTEDGQVKILDFGLARAIDQTRVTDDGTTVGTLHYMSPEQITGADVDQRSDLFSLGVVLYEALSGHRPFPGEHAAAEKSSHSRVRRPGSTTHAGRRTAGGSSLTAFRREAATSGSSRVSDGGLSPDKGRTRLRPP